MLQKAASSEQTPDTGCRKGEDMCFYVLLTAALTADEPRPIGVSFSAQATAFNNSRKIARTYADRRAAVYQDLVDGRDAVQLTCSDVGKTWSDPRLLAYGCSPTIAVFADTFYVLWDSPADSGLCLAAFAAADIGNASASARRLVIPDKPGAYRSRLPSMDVDDAFVHIVFHSVRGGAGRVVYYAVKRDLSPLDGFGPFHLTRVGDAHDAVIAADLLYEPGCIHLLWTFDKLDESNIIYCAFDLKRFLKNGAVDSTALRRALTEENPPQILAGSSGCALPSLSVRNFIVDENLQLLTFAWENWSQLQVS